MPTPWFRRGLLAAVATGVTLVWWVAPVAAQEQPSEPNPAVPTEVPESQPIEGGEEIPTDSVAPNSTLLPPTTTPTTRLPQACTPVPQPDVVFVGRVSAYQIPTFRFDVLEVREGTVATPQVDVQFEDDYRFVELGQTYLVAARVDPRTGLLESKVQSTSKTIPEPGTCEGDDPVITRYADGSPVDTAVLRGMQGRWGEVGLAFAVPVAGVLGLLLVVVALKHVLQWMGRSVAR